MCVYMCDFILFIVLLILIAASVALVFLILFADNSKKNASENVIDYNMLELTDNDIDL